MNRQKKDPITFHAVPKFDPSSGCLPKSSGGLPSYSKNLWRLVVRNGSERQQADGDYSGDA